MLLLLLLSLLHQHQRKQVKWRHQHMSPIPMLLCAHPFTLPVLMIPSLVLILRSSSTQATETVLYLITTPTPHINHPIPLMQNHLKDTWTQCMSLPSTTIITNLLLTFNPVMEPQSWEPLHMNNLLMGLLLVPTTTVHHLLRTTLLFHVMILSIWGSQTGGLSLHTQCHPHQQDQNPLMMPPPTATRVLLSCRIFWRFSLEGLMLQLPKSESYVSFGWLTFCSRV